MIKIVLVCCICCWSAVAPAQNAGMGTLAPDSSAQLDIQSTTRGLLIPSMTQSQLSGIVSPATGLLVFQIDHGAGFYYNAGTPAAPSWQALATPSGSAGWKLAGNGGTDPATDFVGTTDSKPLLFRINNVTAGYLDSAKSRTYLGYGAGNIASAGYGSVAIGKNSLARDSAGSVLVAVGDSALSGYRYGAGNVAAGFYALAQNVYGEANTAIGFYSLYSSPGSLNTATGPMALAYNTQGGNTAKGNGALGNNMQGSNNTALGTSAMGLYPAKDYQNYENTAAGAAALADDDAGRGNTAGGYSALSANTSGGANTAIGSQAGSGIGSSGGNTALGAHTLTGATTGSSLTATGRSAGELDYSDPEGGNTCTGSYALYQNAGTGTLCTATGAYALYFNNGKSNTATGYYAMHGTGQDGSDNTAFGASTLNQLVATSDGNTAYGNQALYFCGSCSYNTAAGYGALYQLSVTNYNTAIGYAAGIGYNPGFYNTILGANCDIANSGLTNCVAIGQQVTCTDNNQVRIGNLATNSIGGQVGWSTLSDGRFKKNIRENVKGLDFIVRLKPVTYRLDMDMIKGRLYRKKAYPLSAAMTVEVPAAMKVEVPAAITADINANGQTTYSGFVAQDVEQAAAEAGFAFSGVDKPSTADGLYGLRYEDFVVPLVKAVQEQQQQIEALQRGNIDMQRRVKQVEQKVKH